MIKICKLTYGVAVSSLLWNVAPMKADAAKRPQKVQIQIQTILLRGGDRQQQDKTLATAFSSPKDAEQFVAVLRRDLAQHADTVLTTPVFEGCMTINQTSLVVVTDPTPGQSEIVGILTVTPQLAPNGETKLIVAASHIVPISPGSQWFFAPAMSCRPAEPFSWMG